MKRLIPHILLSLAACAFNANAGIINADTTDYNAYQDTDTGLVWLDFGENNNQSYNYVASQLGEGGEWAGWRLPTIDEVYTMWGNVANLDGVEADYENADQYGAGQFYAYDYNPNEAGGDSTLWTSMLEIIGYNSTVANQRYTIRWAYGWFEGTDGLSHVDFVDSVDLVGGDSYVLQDYFRLFDSQNLDSEKDNTSVGFSTLLVRDMGVENITAVSEPTTLAIFALSLLGLAARRKSR